MKLNLADQRRFEAEIVKLIRTGKLPSYEQVHAAIATTRQKFQPLILAARAEVKRKLNSFRFVPRRNVQ